MFQRVMDWLEADDETREIGFGDESVRVSIAALFYHMISIDGVVSPAEKTRFLTLLGERYRLSGDQIDRLAKRGKDMDQSSAGVFPFTVVLNHELDLEERQEVLVQLDDLARADGVVHPLEIELLDQMKVMLKLAS